MKRFSDSVWSGLALLAFPFALSARAQCPEWKPGLHVNGIDREVAALASFDDGSGPKLYAGGRFRSASGVSPDPVDAVIWMDP